MKRISLLLLLAVLAVDSVMAQNKALSLDGDGDYAEIPNSEVVDITDEIAIAAWVVLNGTSRDVEIIFRQLAYEYGVYSNDKAETEVFTDGRYHLTRWEDGGTVLDQGPWYLPHFWYIRWQPNRNLHNYVWINMFLFSRVFGD